MGLASAVSLPVGVSVGVGGRDIFLFTSPQGRYRSEGVQSRFLPGHKPRQALGPPLSFVLVTAGALGRTVSALAHQVVRGSVPCLLVVCIYSLKIYTHQLPPGLFLLSGSTLRSPLAKNNPEKEEGKRGREQALSSARPAQSQCYSTFEAEPPKQLLSECKRAKLPGFRAENGGYKLWEVENRSAEA